MSSGANSESSYEVVQSQAEGKAAETTRGLDSMETVSGKYSDTAVEPSYVGLLDSHLLSADELLLATDGEDYQNLEGDFELDELLAACDE